MNTLRVSKDSEENNLNKFLWKISLDIQRHECNFHRVCNSKGILDFICKNICGWVYLLEMRFTMSPETTNGESSGYMLVQKITKLGMFPLFSRWN